MSGDTENRSEKALCHLCSELDLTEENGLVRDYTDTKDEYQRYLLRQAREKLGIDAIFFLKPQEGPSIPLIYFRKLESRAPHEIAELHKLVWNMGQAPLFFVVLPDVVLIYSTYEPPKTVDGKLDDEARFIEELNLFVEAESEIKKLRKYHRSELITGRYWQEHSDKFKKEKRVYRTLLNNLDFMREKLIEKGLSSDIVHSLLIRSMFIKYLEDRKDSNGYNAFPEGFFEKFLRGASCFTDVLSDKAATYRLFRYLDEDKFNGDIFAIEEAEEGKIYEHHLELLQDLLKGEKYLESGQMMLWPLYSFDVIPIELISNIYQQFFHYEKGKKGKKRGTYYTPYYLVTFLMDEVLPWEGKTVDEKILDPSCGSGVFLVEAYRRLIDRWMQKHPEKHPSFSDLKDILRKNIFGVDINREAIQIAALSLYLTICDYLEPRNIWSEVKFEPLINNNLFVSDFFEEDNPFLNEKYDLVIGNSPWESELTEPAKRYVEKKGNPVGDKQISQAFLWKVAELCEPGGEICLIVSSKGLLFNRWTTNREFRKQFFSTFNVKTVINFSALRHSLFSEAVGPGAAVLFSPDEPDDCPIFYFSPKPSYSPQDDWLLLIEPQDIAHIPKDEAYENDVIWKVAMWGNPRDYELIRKLSELPTLGEICEKKKWIHAEGFKFEGGKKHEAPELFGKPIVHTRKLQRFTMDEKSLPINDVVSFHRSVKTKREIFQGPHLLIKQSPRAGTGLVAALLRKDAIFKHAILGIHGEESDLNHLASCCLTITSKIALYYEMLTARSWLVERDSFEKEEIMDLPMPENILDLHTDYEFLEKLSENSETDEIVNELVMDWFDLTESEKILIDDAIDFTLDYFRKKDKSIAVNPVTLDTLKDYIYTFCTVLNNSFSNPRKVFVGKIFVGENPLQVISARLVDKSEEKTRVHQDHTLTEVLVKLDRTLLEEKSQSIYMRRNLRHYTGNTIYIVKPNHMKYWTKSAALRDADEVYADVMTLWRGIQ